MVSVLSSRRNPLVNPAVRFTLDESFLESYKQTPPPFGFAGLSEVVYLRSYSRLKEDGTNEQWWETVRRVVEGTYAMQKRWILANHLGWDEAQGQRSAQEMFDRMFQMKFLPPGRGLWAMGSALTEERGLFAALNNCAFVSTATLAKDKAEPFCFLMDASMLGIGVGFDTKGAGILYVHAPQAPHDAPIVIPDSREGWVDSVRLLLTAFFTSGKTLPVFDYSQVRPAGEAIKGFGGVASGPGPLQELHRRIITTLTAQIGRPLSVTTIVDLMNMIGDCVVAGNVRRTAEIAFGPPTSEEFLDLKNPEVNPARMDPQTGWGYTSNNSIFAEIGMDYAAAGQRTQQNGEPGYAWLENMRAYGRMEDLPTYRDARVAGANPCNEQSLESYELCCLVETFPARHESLEDYLRTLKFAYLYAKTVTLGPTPWETTNRVMMRNRRIGCSMSGLAQFIGARGLHTLRTWCQRGYQEIQRWDSVYSEWFTIPRSIKTTSIKPSGSVSLLAGATPGMHFPEARSYLRRVIISKYSDLVPALQAAGYPVEDHNHDTTAVVVTFPIQLDASVRTVAEVSMWEQLALAAFLQRYWADNQVSCTVTFDPEREGAQIATALTYYQYQLKGISFLPRLAQGAYPQMPYEAVSAEYLATLQANIRPLRLGATHELAEQERFCDGETCQLPVAA